MLGELRKFEDARNAFARAIQARPEFAEAHYNLSFTLSNLGDHEGALRETKRALELDPVLRRRRSSRSRSISNTKIPISRCCRISAASSA